ncbi:MAG: NAD(P)H-hydrate dehydratase [Candidatus Omnitrophota bacterium]
MPAQLSHRKIDAHKKDFGHVFILAGSVPYAGAACLSAQAAMRAGAGLVTLGVPERLYEAVVSHLLEVMVVPLPELEQHSLSKKAFKNIKNYLGRADSVLVGPGLSRHAQTQQLIRSVIGHVSGPMLLDADGLNAFEGRVDLLKNLKNPIVLTPHPKEMSRLTGFSVKQIQENRKEVAKNFALRYNLTLVLKGHETIVVDEKGKTYVNETGNPGMATAGTGDVLSGVIASFLAQGLSAFEASKFGVYIHGLAADCAVKDKTPISLIASDIIDYLPAAFKKVRFDK